MKSTFYKASRGYVFKYFSKNDWKALLVLILGLAITVILTLYTHDFVEKQAQEDFLSVSNEIKLQIDARLQAHVLILRAGTALFAVSDTVTRAEWREFIERSQIEETYPGIQGVGFSVVVPKNRLQEHIQKIREEGFPDYTIYPSGDREIYTSIIYLEPFSDRNLRAFGYDMYSQPTRRRAMELSRDRNVAMLSGKVDLVQETSEDVQSGTLMYVPVYKHGMPVATVEQRRSAIQGWVYSPYRMDDLMRGILGRWNANQHNRIHLQVYDDSLSVETLLYDSQKNELNESDDGNFRSILRPVEFNGRKWILLFTQSKELHFSTGQYLHHTD